MVYLKYVKRIAVLLIVLIAFIGGIIFLCSSISYAQDIEQFYVFKRMSLLNDAKGVKWFLSKNASDLIFALVEDDKQNALFVYAFDGVLAKSKWDAPVVIDTTFYGTLVKSYLNKDMLCLIFVKGDALSGYTLSFYFVMPDGEVAVKDFISDSDPFIGDPLSFNGRLYVPIVTDNLIVPQPVVYSQKSDFDDETKKQVYIVRIDTLTFESDIIPLFDWSGGVAGIKLVSLSNNILVEVASSDSVSSLIYVAFNEDETQIKFEKVGDVLSYVVDKKGDALYFVSACDKALYIVNFKESTLGVLSGDISFISNLNGDSLVEKGIALTDNIVDLKLFLDDTSKAIYLLTKKGSGKQSLYYLNLSETTTGRIKITPVCLYKGDMLSAFVWNRYLLLFDASGLFADDRVLKIVVFEKDLKKGDYSFNVDIGEEKLTSAFKVLCSDDDLFVVLGGKAFSLFITLQEDKGLSFSFLPFAVDLVWELQDAANKDTTSFIFIYKGRVSFVKRLRVNTFKALGSILGVMDKDGKSYILTTKGLYLHSFNKDTYSLCWDFSQRLADAKAKKIIFEGDTLFVLLENSFLYKIVLSASGYGVVSYVDRDIDDFIIYEDRLFVLSSGKLFVFDGNRFSRIDLVQHGDFVKFIGVTAGSFFIKGLDEICEVVLSDISAKRSSLKVVSFKRYDVSVVEATICDDYLLVWTENNFYLYDLSPLRGKETSFYKEKQSIPANYKDLKIKRSGLMFFLYNDKRLSVYKLADGMFIGLWDFDLKGVNAESLAVFTYQNFVGIYDGKMILFLTQNSGKKALTFYPYPWGKDVKIYSGSRLCSVVNEFCCVFELTMLDFDDSSDIRFIPSEKDILLIGKVGDVLNYDVKVLNVSDSALNLSFVLKESDKNVKLNAFDVEPKNFVLTKGDIRKLDIVFNPSKVGDYSAKLILKDYNITFNLVGKAIPRPVDSGVKLYSWFVSDALKDKKANLKSSDDVFNDYNELTLRFKCKAGSKVLIVYENNSIRVGDIKWSVGKGAVFVKTNRGNWEKLYVPEGVVLGGVSISVSDNSKFDVDTGKNWIEVILKVKRVSSNVRPLGGSKPVSEDVLSGGCSVALGVSLYRGILEIVLPFLMAFILRCYTVLRR